MLYAHSGSKTSQIMRTSKKLSLHLQNSRQGRTKVAENLYSEADRGDRKLKASAINEELEAALKSIKIKLGSESHEKLVTRDEEVRHGERHESALKEPQVETRSDPQP